MRLSNALVVVLLLLAASCKRPVPPPPPPPSPPPSPGIADVRLHPNNPRYLLVDGKPRLVAAYGNIVTAIPGHEWRDDIAQLVRSRAGYARLWHMLGSETQEWPWLRLPNGKWDLSQWNETYWKTIGEALAEARTQGIIVEPHIFDRGCGGTQQDYRSYPWHPDNNVNRLHAQLPTGGTGLPEFYEAEPRTPLHELQKAYVLKWVEQTRSYRNVILEIENEHREHTRIRWAAQWARLIKANDPQRLLAYSSLETDFEDIYKTAEIDVANIHSGREGRDPAVLAEYLSSHWSRNKLMNVDEFANGERDPKVLRDQVWSILTSGGHFHVEDAKPSSDPFQFVRRFEAEPTGASSGVRRFLAESGWRFHEAAPKDGCMVSATQQVCYAATGKRVIVASDGSARWWNAVEEGFGPPFAARRGERLTPSTDSVLLVEK